MARKEAIILSMTPRRDDSHPEMLKSDQENISIAKGRRCGCIRSQSYGKAV